MNSWTDFEKYVFEKLEKIDHRLTIVETKSLVYGSIGGILTSVFLTIGTIIIRKF